MLISEFEDEEFNGLIDDGTILLDFYADWCGPCKMLKEVIDEFSSKNNDIKVIKINVDKHHVLSKKFGVMTIPTLILFKERKQIKKNIGFIPLEELVKWVNN